MRCDPISVQQPLLGQNCAPTAFLGPHYRTHCQEPRPYHEVMYAYSKVATPRLAVRAWSPFLNELFYVEERLHNSVFRDLWPQAKSLALSLRKASRRFLYDDVVSAKDAVEALPSYETGALLTHYLKRSVDALRAHDEAFKIFYLGSTSKKLPSSSVRWLEGEYGKPEFLHIDFVSLDNHYVMARLNLIAAYRKSFPEMPIIIMAPGFLALFIWEKLANRGVSTSFIYIVGIPINDFDFEQGCLPWPGDAFAATQRQGHDQILINRVLSSRVKAMADFAQADVVKLDDKFDTLQFGNCLPVGADRGMAGVNSIIPAKIDMDDLANLLGRSIDLVGDQVRGQAIYHIDLYLRPLPNGHVLVADFRKGRDVLLKLSIEDVRNILEEHRRKESDGHEITKSLFYEFMQQLIDGKDDFYRALHAFTEMIAVKIDDEVESLKSRGVVCHAVTAYPLFSQVGGLTHLNSEIFRDSPESYVMFVPFLGSQFDHQFEQEAREAGYDGKISFVPGIIHSLLENAAGIHCMTYAGYSANPRRKSLVKSQHVLDLNALPHIFGHLKNLEADYEKGGSARHIVIAKVCSDYLSVGWWRSIQLRRSEKFCKFVDEFEAKVRSYRTFIKILLTALEVKCTLEDFIS